MLFPISFRKAGGQPRPLAEASLLGTEHGELCPRSVCFTPWLSGSAAPSLPCPLGGIPVLLREISAGAVAGSSFPGKPCELKVDRIFCEEAVQSVIPLPDLGQQIPSHFFLSWLCLGLSLFFVDHPQSRLCDLGSQNLWMRAFYPVPVSLHPSTSFIADPSF